ncbi:SGNH/GDSL hydrolase family protein [Petropleomorpha daqingensis]|uniref:Lysophospholipase L1-like esterase n=1 Tax=Petropleomorpha daqingensis TaxID=2026353 RepID=A0A853CS73_9ACTN|nr:lysophospholipase L1-like esterase [Petropleomorpha daqingensis]
MPGQRLRPPRSRLLAAVAVVLAAAAAVLVATGVPGGAAPSPTPPPAIHLVAGKPLVAFLGDSWTAGVGATGRRGYVVRTVERLGWGYANFGVGGSGYSVPGPHHSLFAQRIPQLVALHPDLVVVQGSLNERHSTPEALGPAARTTLAELKAALPPGTPVLVVGACYNPGTADPTIDWINAGVSRAAAAAELPFVDPAAAGWLDPHDPGLWFDTIHPDDRGHQRFADALAPLLRDLARDRDAQKSPVTVLG